MRALLWDVLVTMNRVVGKLWGVYRRVQWKKESNHKKVLWRGYVNEFSFEDFVQFLNFSLSADISITNLYAED